jgi:hypothetical protein
VQRTCRACEGIARELVPFTGPDPETVEYRCESCGETFYLHPDGMLRLVDDAQR